MTPDKQLISLSKLQQLLGAPHPGRPSIRYSAPPFHPSDPFSVISAELKRRGIDI